MTRPLVVTIPDGHPVWRHPADGHSEPHVCSDRFPTGQVVFNRVQRRRPVLCRVLSAVEVTESGCWHFRGAVGFNGYGSIVTNGRYDRRMTHRLTYELLVGPVPDGLQVDHLCRNRMCCNPAHLEAVTQQVNVVRGIPFRPFVDRCRNGHERTADNTRFRPDNGARRCLDCERDKYRRACAT